MGDVMSDGGKGSAPRPLSVDNETFNRNFEAIFGKKNDKDSPSTECPVAETNDDQGTESTPQE
jgi:hypothetical protein